MDNLEIIFKKTIETLKAAEVTFANGFYETSINRSYYAVFYAANALLMKKGIKTKTHKGIVKKFNLEYIHNDNFDKDLGRILSKLQKERIKADYDFYLKPTENKAKKDLNDARRFIEECKKFL